MALVLNFGTAVANIKANYYASTQYPTLYHEGILWYFTARNQLKRMAKRNRVSLDVTASVTAVLSPNNKWLRNTVDTENCIHVAASGGNAKDVKCSTYGDNKIKAFRILRGESYSAVLGGNKVSSFFWNLRYPDDLYCVTIDGHAVAIALGARIALSKTPQLSDKSYQLLGDAYRQATDEINVDSLVGVNLLPSQVQAVTWTYYRFIHNLK